jgi:hypothetical protein
MFLVLIATEELKEFFAKARAGSIRLIKVIIEDGECPPRAGAWNGGRTQSLLGIGELGISFLSAPPRPQSLHLRM